jgi:uncharacterized protein (DUF58 family)
MLSKEVIRKIRRIEIRSRRLVSDVFAGEYKSVFKGRGMEFLEVREYYPGDDVRNIDWNVTARMGSPYIKKFSEERELTIMILFDASGSGDFGTRCKTKREIASEIGALLAFSAIRNNDKVGLIIFTDRVEKFVPPKKGRRHVLRLIREFLAFKPNHKKTDIKCALDFLGGVITKRCILFLVSDFLSSGYERAFRTVNKKNDAIAVRIADPLELNLQKVGIIEFEDPETDELIYVDTNDSDFRKAFRTQMIKKLKGTEKFFQQSGIDYIDIRTDKSYIEPLIKFFLARARRIR